MPRFKSLAHAAGCDGNHQFLFQHKDLRMLPREEWRCPARAFSKWIWDHPSPRTCPAGLPPGKVLVYDIPENARVKDRSCTVAIGQVIAGRNGAANSSLGM